MARMSNRERIQRAAAEAQATEKDKKDTKKKATKKKTTKKTTKKAATKVATAGGRMKMVWRVVDANSKVVAEFPFPEKDKAEAKAKAMTKKDKVYSVKPAKVPMD